MLRIVIYKKLNFWEEYTPLAHAQDDHTIGVSMMSSSLLLRLNQHKFTTADFETSGVRQTEIEGRCVHSHMTQSCQ